MPNALQKAEAALVGAVMLRIFGGPKSRRTPATHLNRRLYLASVAYAKAYAAAHPKDAQ